MYVVFLSLTGFVIAIVFFVAIGLLVDLLPRAPEKQQSAPKASWLARLTRLVTAR